MLHVVRRAICLAADVGIGVSKSCLDDLTGSGIESTVSAREMAEPKNRIPSDIEMRM